MRFVSCSDAPHHYLSSGSQYSCSPKSMQHLEPPSVLSYTSKKGSFGDTDKSKTADSQEFYFSQILKLLLTGVVWSCNNICCPSHEQTAWNTKGKMHVATLPEYFHHGNPPGNSPAAHLHCQFSQHIRPLSRSWQLWHLAHPGNPGSHTEWQWCSHTWFVRVQVHYWGELDLFYSISAHIVPLGTLHWIRVLYFYTTSSIFIQLQMIFPGIFSFPQAEHWDLSGSLQFNPSARPPRSGVQDKAASLSVY